MNVTFETTTCDRCGGSGYMPFAAYGGVCFKCNKAGKVFTRKGAAARKAFVEARNAACPKLLPGELKVGMKVSQDGNIWRTVAEPVDLETPHGRQDGEPLFLIVTQKSGIMVRADETVMVKTPEAFHAGVARVRRMSGAIISEA